MYTNDKGRCWRVTFDTLISDCHLETEMSITHMLTLRQEIGEGMLSTEEIMTHHKLKILPSQRTAALEKKTSEPWLTHLNSNLQAWWWVEQETTRGSRKLAQFAPEVTWLPEIVSGSGHILCWPNVLRIIREKEKATVSQRLTCTVFLKVILLQNELKILRYWITFSKWLKRKRINRTLSWAAHIF